MIKFNFEWMEINKSKIEKAHWNLINYLSATFWLPWISQNEFQVTTTILTSIYQILGYQEFLTWSYWVQLDKVTMFHIMHYTFKNLLCKLDNFLFQLFHVTFQLWDLHVLVLLNRIQLIFLLFFLCLNVTWDSNVTINIEAYLSKLFIISNFFLLLHAY